MKGIVRSLVILGVTVINFIYGESTQVTSAILGLNIWNVYGVLTSGRD